MVEVKARDIPATVKKLGRHVRAAALFGPDAGMVRDYARQIALQVAESLDDPFSVVRLSPKDLNDNTGLLADEMASISMMGGRRLVWLEGADKNCVEAVKLALSAPGLADQDSFLLVTAGDIRKTDALIKPFVAEGAALAIACYGDEGGALADLISSTLMAAGLRAEPEAMTYLVAHLGGDRMVSKSELEKLVLYMGPAPEGAAASQVPLRPVTLADARANIGDASSFALFQIAESVTAGNRVGLEDGLDRAWTNGENPIAVLRVVTQRVMKLQQARLAVDKGVPAREAVTKLGVFWKDADAFTRQLERWPVMKLARALDILLEAEVACKTTGNPAQILCARALLSLAKAA